MAKIRLLTSVIPGPCPGVQSDPEGSLWRDPPGYWEDIVYPAYLDAHKDLFVDGDVENEPLTSAVTGLILIESLEISMGDAVERCCSELKEMAEKF